MNKAELTAAVMADTGLSKPQATTAIDSVFANITGTLAKKEIFQLVGFGSFSTGTRKAHTGRNPQTGDAINIPASVSIKFKAGKAFKDTVNK